jgi:hypothetical protein
MVIVGTFGFMALWGLIILVFCIKDQLDLACYVVSGALILIGGVASAYFIHCIKAELRPRYETVNLYQSSYYDTEQMYADLVANGYDVTLSHTTEGEPALLVEELETTKNLMNQESVRTVYEYIRADLTPTPTPTFVFNPTNYKLTKETE